MEVRVRYAPSPTGFQHIGGVRTALFNYLFAKANGGKFILRIEDTDRTRYDSEYEKNLFDTLDWLRIDWDEGGQKGGNYGPYTQSERTELYKKYAQQLVDVGQAYYCFCDSERLERIRKIQTMNNMPPGYDRACRDLSPEEIKENLDKGIPYVIRLKIPLEGVTKFHDSVIGDVEWKNEDINPDPVLLKSDGFPTYHLANIVDDHLMNITHVMRAQEWLPSTPMHVIMYNAFGWQPPQFCHLPMVMGNDGQKLSKRHGAASCNDFRNKGYLSEAIVNYVALLGCSYEEGKELYTLDELGARFDTAHLNKAPAVFDYKKLDWFNGQYIRSKTDAELFELTWGFIVNAGIFGAPPTMQSIFLDETNLTPNEEQRAKLMKAMPLIRERIHLLSEAPDMVRFLFVDPPLAPLEDFVPKKLNAETVKTILEIAKSIIPQLEGLSEEAGFELFKPEGERLQVKMGDFMTPIRVAVTGSRISPPLVGSIQILGYDKAIHRIDTVLEKYF